jgi:thiamine biosynthesis lipoprotein
MQRHRFRAMGTDVELLLDAPESAESALALATGEAEFERLEGLLSRFREDSELSALNRSGVLYAGPDLAEVTDRALDARERTHSRFDPTVHDALVAAGYDRSFEQIEGRVATATVPGQCGGSIDIDRATGRIELEPGFRLDLGGIAKGYAVDRVAQLLALAGPCLVDAGGDIAALGTAWPVGIETHEGVITVALEDAALATSGVDRRRWQTTEGDAHHIIDPRTGRPAETDLLRVTVVANDAVEAEVLAKALFLAGSEQAVRDAGEMDVAAVLLTLEGETVLTGRLA